MIYIRYGQIRSADISNGPGIRVSLFVTGCTLNCKDCFNKEYQDFNYGKLWTSEVQDKFIELVNQAHISGVSILGGEPLQQDDSLKDLIVQLKKSYNKSIWMWTGYNIAELNERQLSIVKLVDVLVDGRFQIDKKSLKLKYRGSSNQRVINVKSTLSENKIIELNI